MDVSRRDVVKAAGMTAAAVGLSGMACGSQEPAPEKEEPATVMTGEDRVCEHTVVITRCGQYVVVESSNACDGGGDPAAGRRAFRGRVEARWGDTLTIRNSTPGAVTLYFPEPDIFVDGLKGDKEITIEAEGERPLTLGRKPLGGVYEYAVLYAKEIEGLRPTGDGATWGFAIGGSSPVIDIRI